MCLRRVYERAFAGGMRHLGRGYRRIVDARKPRLFADLAGKVLDIGCGTGANLRFLPAGVGYWGVDSSPYMLNYARAEAKRLGRRAALVRGDAAQLAFPNGSFDAVIATLVLCSVPDPARVLAEVRRVLQPGGRFVFLEHVAAQPGSRLRGWQRRSVWLWRMLGDGCSPARETERTIASAGFARMEMETFDVPVPIFRPHLAGVAVNG